MAKADLTAQRLREVLHYDPETGVFARLSLRGKAIDTPHCKGYRVIRIDGTLYLAHRIAWLYMTGEWPMSQIDHVNGIRACNEWGNLREATPAQNQQNMGRSKANTSGHAGVSWHANSGKWRARIGLNGRELSLGYFESFEDAVKARADAKRRLHAFNPFERTSATGL